jgi:arabinogalactan oligomer/maltooligosaccharide transport system permease protein
VLHVVIGVLVAVLLNTKGLMFRGFYRALFILPVVIPSLIVATVWRNMFDTDAGRGELPDPGRRRPLRPAGGFTRPST